jgi:hypothetical protein
MERFQAEVTSKAELLLTAVTATLVIPLPCFSQVLILNVVKVACFHTDLEVLILMNLESGPSSEWHGRTCPQKTVNARFHLHL